MPNFAQMLFNFSTSAAFHQDKDAPYPKLMKLLCYAAAEGETGMTQRIDDLENLSYFKKGEIDKVISHLHSENFTVKVEDGRLKMSWTGFFL